MEHVGRAKTALATALEGSGWQKGTKKQMYYVIYVQKGKGANRAASPGPTANNIHTVVSTIMYSDSKPVSMFGTFDLTS